MKMKTEEPSLGATKDKIDFWHKPFTIERNNFIYKSLSSWAANIGIGCEHSCAWCYVPSVSTNKMGAKLKEYGVEDPDAEWGEYFLLRQWDEELFRRSALRAQRIPLDELNADGNRAVIYCSTTDPYQVIRHKDLARRVELREAMAFLVRRSLEIIRDETDLNVRILTRSPLARNDFDLFKSFGNRLLFGMSLPTLNHHLAKVYEPNVPAPSVRLQTLQAARNAGLHVYVAMAPTYPECGADDLLETLEAIKELEPVTVFHEPINVRAENIARIQVNAKLEGVPLNTAVFASRESWAAYAMEALKFVERTGEAMKLPLHLWPDKGLERFAEKRWLNKYWNRVSEWPK